MKERCIVYITDENYTMPTCISILSLIMSLQVTERVRIYVFTDSVSVDSKNKLRELARNNVDIQLLDVNSSKYKEISQSLVSQEIHVSTSALFKFEIADILSEIDTILYLDGDVLVNKNIDKLFQTALEDVYIAAVDDMGDTIDEDGKSYLASRIGIKNHVYFNSGVMLLNLKKMREDNISARLMEYRSQGINYFMDQDTFNAVLCDKRIFLSYEYNFRAPLFDAKTFEEINEQFYEGKYKTIEECIGNQVIIHLSDKLKPWKYNIPWFTDIFKKYYDISPYKDQKLTLLSPLKPLRDEIIELEKAYSALFHFVKKHKVWRLPKERIPKGCDLILYGAGEVGQDYYRQIMDLNWCKVVLWVDKNFMTMENVQNPKLIDRVEADYILIAIEREEYVKEVRRELETMGIKSECVLEGF